MNVFCFMFCLDIIFFFIFLIGRAWRLYCILYSSSYPELVAVEYFDTKSEDRLYTCCSEVLSHSNILCLDSFSF